MSTATITPQQRRASGTIAYPMHHILGIIPNAADLATIVGELEAAGFAQEAIWTLYGEQGCCCLDAEGARHGPLLHLLRVWQHFTPEYDQLAHYEQAVRDGHCVLAVRAAHQQERETAQAIMTRYGGHYIHYYSWMIYPLVP